MLSKKYLVIGGPVKLRLEGKSALVCGASQGIGRATAVELASLGARVFALARNQQELEKLVAELPPVQSQSKLLTHQMIIADVGQRSALRSAIEKALSEGNIEILVCNTSGPKGGPLAEATEGDFLQTFENHLLVNHLLTQMLLPGMKQAAYGRIINVISTSVKIPIVNLGVSNTIRGAVASWAKTLSLEVASHGVTVNNVLPGYTKTQRLETLLKATSDKTKRSLEDVTNEWLKTIPAGRFADASEVASAIAFLASPAAAYINGVSLPVDGGRTGSI